MKLKKTLAGVLASIMAISCMALPASADSSSFSITSGDVAGQCRLQTVNVYYDVATTSASRSTLNCRFTYISGSNAVTIKSFTLPTGKQEKYGFYYSSDGTSKVYQLTALVNGTSAVGTGTLISVE